MDTLTAFLAPWLQTEVQPLLLKELALLAMVLLLSWLVTRQLSHFASGGSVLFGRGLFDGLLFPMLALALTYVAQVVFLKQQTPMLLKLAIPVLWSLALIRLSARVLMAVFPVSPLAQLTERLISWLVWGVAVLWITDLLPLVATEMEQVQLHFGKVRLDARTLLEGVLSCGLVLILSLWLSATIENRLLAQAVSDLSMRKVAANLLRAVLLLVGLLFALSAVGVDLTALSVLGGAFGVGLGLGLQKLAANYVSGFVVLVERSVRIGDYIKVDGLEGRVTDIKTRYTLLRDPSGRESIIPNDMLLTQRVDNLSLSDPQIAVHCTYPLGTDVDIDRVLGLLSSAALQSERVLREPPPQAFLSKVESAGLEFTVVSWVSDPESAYLKTRSQINTAVVQALHQAGIELPKAPQQVFMRAPAP
ncbi:MAG: mechanosensitive ion channel protein [Betaproteobacteria bacterium]|nr:mechanosensitive ion channel protein [Betaproteobacteria bacterium]